MNDGVNKVLNFWFQELSPRDWWVKNEELDQEIRRRFLELHSMALKGELYSWRETAEGRLAEIIILDQFSRNIYRGERESFLADGMALTLSQVAIAVGDDQLLEKDKRLFLYLPFMHSESLPIHDVAVKLFEDLGLKENLEFEHKHRDIIERFGRYPHRNSILERESTKEEEDFLKTPGSSF